MTSFFVSAYQKGIRNFDIEKAYEGLRKNHMPGGMMGHSGYEHNSAKGGGIEHYMEKGYVPFPLPEGKFGNQQMGAGMTLEYAYQDWVLAQFARALGKNSDYHYFMKRSENYRTLYDFETGWIRPKNGHGEWRTPFDPYEYNAGLIESNAAQFTWSVPHDIQGLAELMGGKEIAVKRLNEQFEQAARLGFTSGTSHEVETHPEYRRIPINYGNQESMQTAFIFNYLDRPDLTQYWSRRIIMEVQSEFSPARGYNGDEDQGLMGALSVIMKMGLFQMNGGTEENPAYEIGSPVFDEITIQLNPQYYSNKTFVIKTINNGPENYRIKSKTLNGKPVEGFRIYHNDIIKGGELVLEMGNN
jgi:predicted alpha-1,2-mannosidase